MTGIVALFAFGSPEDQAETAKPARTRVGVSTPDARREPTLDLARLSRPDREQVQDTLFYVPPPPPPPRVAAAAVQPPPPPPPPPKPAAPPLPFKFLGRLVDSGTTIVFVSLNGQNLGLKQGDRAAEVYRVENISASEVVFLYEPLAERQVLSVGAVN